MACAQRILSLTHSWQGFLVPNYRRHQIGIALTIVAFACLLPAPILFGGWLQLWHSFALIIAILGVLSLILTISKSVGSYIPTLGFVVDMVKEGKVSETVMTIVAISPLTALLLGITTLTISVWSINARSFRTELQNFWLSRNSQTAMPSSGLRFGIQRNEILRHSLGPIISIVAGMSLIQAFPFLALAVFLSMPGSIGLSYPFTIVFMCFNYFRWSSAELKLLWQLSNCSTRWQFILEIAIGSLLKTLVMIALLVAISQSQQETSLFPIRDLISLALLTSALLLSSIGLFPLITGIITVGTFASHVPNLLLFAAITRACMLFFYIWQTERKAGEFVSVSSFPFWIPK